MNLEQEYWAIHNAIISMTPIEACKLNLHSLKFEAEKRLMDVTVDMRENENAES